MVLLSLPSTLTAQPPAVVPHSLTNAASHKPLNDPGGALAPGARFRIEGARLAAATLLWDGEPLTTNSKTDTLLEAQVPTRAKPGTHSLTILNADGRTPALPIPVVSSAPGIFTANRLGWGPLDPARSYRPGQQLTLSITGLNHPKPQVLIGNIPARILKVLPTRLVAIEQLVIEIPTNAPLGCSVPLSIDNSNVVTLTIGDPAQVCAASASRLPVQAKPTRLGLAAVSRVSHWPLAAVEPILADEFLLAFRNGTFSGHPLLLPPPPGSCTVYTGPSRDGLFGERAIPQLLLATLTGTPLTPISRLHLTSGSHQLDLPFPGNLPGAVQARLGLRDPSNPRTRPLFFEPPSVSLDFASATLPTPEPIQWTNRSAFQSLAVNSPARFTWTLPHPTGEVYLLLGATDNPAATSALALCAAPANAGSFDVPTRILAQLVPINTLPQSLQAFAAILHLRITPATAPSLDQLWLLSSSAASRAITLR